MTKLTVDKETIEQAIDALTKSILFCNHMSENGGWQKTAMACHSGIAALREALAEPAVEQPDDSDINQVHDGNAETSYESMVFGVTTPVREPAPVQEPCAELVEYILQDDIHNRLTPRVVDIAYSAFMIAKQGKNKDDGGPCDWFNDTKPMVMEQLAKIKKDMAEEAAPLRKPSPPAEVPQLTPGEVALMWVSESFDTMSYESCYTRGVKRGEQVVRKNAGLR